MAIQTAVAWKSVATQLATQNTNLEKEILSAQVLGREIDAERRAFRAAYESFLKKPGITTAQVFDATTLFEQKDAELAAQREQVSSSRNQLIDSVNDNNLEITSANTSATLATSSPLNINTSPGVVNLNSPGTVPAAPIPVTTTATPGAQTDPYDEQTEAPPPPPATLQINSPTYVPTKIDISLTLLPIQSRSDISKIFNLQQYASGSLLKGGFW